MGEVTAFETAFTMDASSIKYGPGVTSEVGHDMRTLGAERVMLVTDERLAELPPVANALASLREAGVSTEVFARVRIEPSDSSLEEAIAFARKGAFDGYVAVGGGSSIDTAKAANLYATHPADFLAYVNPPIGEGRPVPGPLQPLVAIPTTTGTGSETTGVCIFDLRDMKAKTGIAHRRLRPVVGLVDPDNTRTLPGMVVACSGFDVLSHALESFTALPFYRRAAPGNPDLRPAYQGANPISDIWAERAIAMASTNIVRATTDPEDHEARAAMMLAATLAGVGFGNAGVHVPHGMSYPVSGMVRSFRPDGYASEHAIVPHGMSVILNAPAVFRWTAEADPERHLRAASLMGASVEGDASTDPGALLAETMIDLMRATGMPNGLKGVGYELDDVDALVDGTLPQHRVTKLSPVPVDDVVLRKLFADSMTLW